MPAACSWQPALPPKPQVPAASDTLYLVAHPTVILREEDVRDLFLGDAPDAATPLLPVDNGAVQPYFLRRVLQLERTQYDKLWSRLAFRDGRRPPQRLANDAAVLDFVRRTPGAVGYVRAPDARVKILGSP